MANIELFTSALGQQSPRRRHQRYHNTINSFCWKKGKKQTDYLNVFRDLLLVRRWQMHRPSSDPSKLIHHVTNNVESKSDIWMYTYKKQVTKRNKTDIWSNVSAYPLLSRGAHTRKALSLDGDHHNYFGVSLSAPRLTSTDVIVGRITSLSLQVSAHSGPHWNAVQCPT